MEHERSDHPFIITINHEDDIAAILWTTHEPLEVVLKRVQALNKAAESMLEEGRQTGITLKDYKRFWDIWYAIYGKYFPPVLWNTRLGIGISSHLNLLADGAKFALYAYDWYRGEYREVDTQEAV